MGQKLSTDEKRKIAEALWEEHGNSVYRFALRLTGNRSVAVDLTSETILAALESLNRLESNQMSRNYLFGITLNKWRRIRRVVTESIDDLIAKESSNVESLIDLETAFRKLSRPLQEAFVLVKAEGFTSKEASQILKIPQGTVQARVHEAVQKMRESLGTPTSIPPIFQEVQL